MTTRAYSIDQVRLLLLADVTRLDGLTRLGQLFVAGAFIALGIEHFVFEEFITGRAPAWPERIPGKLFWAYLSGASIATAGVAIVARWHARSAAILVGVLILLWALLRHVPIVAADTLLSPAWTRAGKALVFFGGAFALAGTLPAERVRNAFLSKFINAKGELVLLGRLCLGIFLLVTGLQHFKYTTFVASLIPAWFPGNPTFWTYFAGVALICGGVGLWLRATAPLAACLSGLMVFSWFWIVHIPRMLTSVSDGIAVFEALAVSGVAFLVAGHLFRSRAEATR